MEIHIIGGRFIGVPLTGASPPHANEVQSSTCKRGYVIEGAKELKGLAAVDSVQGQEQELLGGLFVGFPKYTIVFQSLG